jgi:hypothetical protein
MLIRGWFEDDGGISHAVVHDRREASLCGKPDPSTYEGISDGERQHHRRDANDANSLRDSLH